ncbi:DivIVA domain-containing protein [uncultured Ruminococcus sp.]|uniref:DivIVA domain-containing protein n=1 Tax=uncultured Ruminococcus sp. TaxID=165186 RepID=UPI0025D061DC|nr:DivIVA domain-containing protein [uncultured Ruminococcus sp.]
MLSPNNIKGKSFDTEKNGYSKDDVNEFLAQVAEDYAEVVKANQDTEAKIIKLVEKINEYREDEDAIQQALIVAQKESNKILTEAKTQAHDMIESAKSEQVRLAEQSAAECERIVKEHKEKCAELIRNNTEITEKKINEIRAAYDEELEKYENLKAEVTQFKADLTQLYNRQIRLIMEIPTFEPATDDTAEETVEEEQTEKVQETAPEQTEEPEAENDAAETESAPVTDSEHVEKILNTGSFDPVIPKTAPAELKFGKNN